MKRFFDLTVAALLCIVLLIPLVFIAILIRITSEGKSIYWSKRIGYDSCIFNMPKFRTMKINTPVVATHLIKNVDEYFSPFGSFLRRTSLDELPQIFSVLKGEMSFVGPRPALFNQHDLISLRKQNGVDKVLPGITGWAQINGRDDLSISEKVNLDKEYLEKKSFLFDLKIILLTIFKVIQSDDISH
tara:strand:- start:2327 stop:2887 length:561 start_codon:yes stop_codon:yes gene_type:complete